MTHDPHAPKPDIIEIWEAVSRGVIELEAMHAIEDYLLIDELRGTSDLLVLPFSDNDDTRPVDLGARIEPGEDEQ